MDILFQIQYEWNKEVLCLYYQTQSRKHKRIITLLGGIVIIFAFFLVLKYEMRSS